MTRDRCGLTAPGGAGEAPATGVGILVVDPLEGRRWFVARALGEWASAEDLTILSTSPQSLDAKQIGEFDCRLVILNLAGRSVRSAQATAEIDAVRKHLPEAPMVIMADQDEADEVCAAFEVGAKGFIGGTLDPPILLRALSFILVGGSYYPPAALKGPAGPGRQVSEAAVATPSDPENPPHTAGPRQDTPPDGDEAAEALTARQREVLRLLREGLPNKMIARRLGMREGTVKVHVRQIMRKFGVNNRTQVVLRCQGGAAAKESGSGARRTSRIQIVSGPKRPCERKTTER